VCTKGSRAGCSNPVTMRKHLLVLIALLVTLAGAAPAASEPVDSTWPTADRLFLLAAEDGPLYWSAETNDPEADRGSVVLHCGTARTPHVVDSRPCNSGEALGWPGTLLQKPLTWTAPLRFHTEVSIDPPEAAHAVRFVFQAGSNRWLSPPATEVAPGVYEATVKPGVAYNANLLNYFGVRVESDAPRTVIEVLTGGATYVDLPEPVAAKSVPQLLAESPSPDPNTYATPTRHFAFNDREWQSWSFQGDLAQVRSFDFELPHAAKTIIAWVEAYDTPFMHDVERGLAPDSSKLTDGAGPVLLRGGEILVRGHSANRSTGTPSLVTLGMSAGPLTLRVDRMNTSEANPYAAHVVAVYGERTLASMRWATVAMDAVWNVPLASRCQYPLEPFPVTAEVTTLELDVDWDSVQTPWTDWVLNFEPPGGTFYPCGGLGVRDRVRLTFPGERVWKFGMAPDGAVMASVFDTVFEYEVKYAYTPPPSPE
jgi:hypothetical protein